MLGGGALYLQREVVAGGEELREGGALGEGEGGQEELDPPVVLLREEVGGELRGRFAAEELPQQCAAGGVIEPDT